jgi:hypothetical protein
LYSHLTLTQSCLNKFRKLVRRQRGLLKHVWLRVELGTYTCPSCKTYKSMPERCPDEQIVETAIWELFSILSAWQMAQYPIPDQLTLEVSMYSPSDSQHCFKGDLHLGPDSLDDNDSESWRSRKTTDTVGGQAAGELNARPCGLCLGLLGSSLQSCRQTCPLSTLSPASSCAVTHGVGSHPLLGGKSSKAFPIL